MCGRVSEREEEFLDLPVALSGHSGLEETLNEAYIKLETLEAPNQYFCGSCQKLVDAKRVSNLCMQALQQHNYVRMYIENS